MKKRQIIVVILIVFFIFSTISVNAELQKALTLKDLWNNFVFVFTGKAIAGEDSDAGDKVYYYTLYVSKEGKGSIESNDGKIYCGDSCTSVYPSNTQVILTASPSNGYRFNDWEGCDNNIINTEAIGTLTNCVITMNSDRQVTATFTKIQESCVNECNIVNTKKCDNNGYKICGNYDNDPCLEYSFVYYCSSGLICSNGDCINAPTVPNKQRSPIAKIQLTSENQEIARQVIPEQDKEEVKKVKEQQPLLTAIKDFFADFLNLFKKPVGKRIEKPEEEKLQFKSFDTSEINTQEIKIQASNLQEQTFQGTLSVFHVDDFENPENSKFYYFLQSEGKNYRLISQDEFPHLISGAQVEVRGKLIDNKIFVEDINQDSFEVLNPGIIRPVTGGQQAIVILIKNPGSGDDLFTREQAADIIFNGQINNFFREASYNRMYLQGDVNDVYGWINSPECFGYSQPRSLIEDIMDLVDPQINFSQYVGAPVRIIILIDLGSCVTSLPGGYGYALIGYRDLITEEGIITMSDSYNGAHLFSLPYPPPPVRTINMNRGEATVIHELGHNFGSYHANALECDNEVIGENCDSIEYGNRFDTMGSLGWHGSASHFNAWFKELYGWLDESQILRITQSGTYQLRALERQNAIVAEIMQPNYPQIPSYYLEYREPIGFDEDLNGDIARENINGLFINRIGTYVDRGNNRHKSRDSKILDTKPNNPNDPFWDWFNVALTPEQTFSDPEYGISIKNLGVTRISEEESPEIPTNNPVIGQKMLTFSVNLTQPQCIRKEPIIPPWSLSDYYLVIRRSYNAFWNFEIINRDGLSCASSDFEIILSLPEGWEGLYYTPSPIRLSPGESDRIGFLIFIPETTPPGDYNINIIARNIDSGLQTSYTRPIVVFDPPETELTANPSSGTAPLSVSLTVNSSIGSIIGSNVYYYHEFFCNKGYPAMYWRITQEGSLTTPNICNYEAPGRYRAKVITSLVGAGYLTESYQNITVHPRIRREE